MDNYIIDTNVLIVANEKHEKATSKNIEDCQNFLINVRNKAIISVDSKSLIFNEYFAKANANRSGQPGIGDAFAKWLWENQYNPQVCEIVEIQLINSENQIFSEFDVPKSLEKFDKSDRKFIAVFFASKYQPTICNASDSDWFIFQSELESIGLKIKFLCPNLMKSS